jgi:hypothetical protein
MRDQRIHVNRFINAIFIIIQQPHVRIETCMKEEVHPTPITLYPIPFMIVEDGRMKWVLLLVIPTVDNHRHSIRHQGDVAADRIMIIHLGIERKEEEEDLLSIEINTWLVDTGRMKDFLLLEDETVLVEAGAIIRPTTTGWVIFNRLVNLFHMMEQEEEEEGTEGAHHHQDYHRRHIMQICRKGDERDPVTIVE